MKNGLILFAHGSRDPRWAEPFVRLQALVVTRRPDVPVALAFLELMDPDFAAAGDALIAQGCASLRVVPLFLGQGGHVREDLPRHVAALRARHPGVAVDLRPAVGEDPAILATLAEVALHGLGE